MADIVEMVRFDLVGPGRPAAERGLPASALAAWENADEAFEPGREAREKLAEFGG